MAKPGAKGLFRGSGTRRAGGAGTAAAAPPSDQAAKGQVTAISGAGLPFSSGIPEGLENWNPLDLLPPGGHGTNSSFSTSPEKFAAPAPPISIAQGPPMSRQQQRRLQQEQLLWGPQAPTLAQSQQLLHVMPWASASPGWAATGGAGSLGMVGEGQAMHMEGSTLGSLRRYR